MPGWRISVYRQTDACTLATAEREANPRLAVWMAGPDGLRWIDALVKDGKAVGLGGNGSPCRYTAAAEHLMPHVLGEASGRSEDTLVVDRALAADCRADEWLLVEAWDQS